MAYLTHGRSLIRSTVVDGSVLWDQVLGAFSPIPREPSCTLHWRLSISSSSKGLLILSDYILMQNLFNHLFYSVYNHSFVFFTSFSAFDKLPLNLSKHCGYYLVFFQVLSINISEERRGILGIPERRRLMKLKLDMKRKPWIWVMIFCMISGVVQCFYFSFFWIILRNIIFTWLVWIGQGKIKEGYFKYLYYEIIYHLMQEVKF